MSTQLDYDFLSWYCRSKCLVLKAQVAIFQSKELACFNLFDKSSGN